MDCMFTKNKYNLFSMNNASFSCCYQQQGAAFALFGTHMFADKILHVPPGANVRSHRALQILYTTTVHVLHLHTLLLRQDDAYEQSHDRNSPP